jgi:LysM repeat protein
MIKLIFLAASTWMYPGASPADSLRMEIVNGKKFVIHQVEQRETLYGLSRRYGASLVGILENNPSADAGLEVGQILRIPYGERTISQKSGGKVHVVSMKETLFSISRLYQITVDEIKQWNNLADNSISVGQELIIQKPENGSITPSVLPDVKVEDGYHRVAAGETLFSLSREYSVSVSELKEWNQLTAPDLQVGQVIRVAKSGTRPDVNIPTQKPTDATAQSTPAIRESAIQISENVAGSNEVRETGLAELIEGTDGNRKYLALHRTAPTGTILKVRNELNNREVFVRVVGPLPPTGVNERLIIKISKSAFDRLGAIDAKFRAEVTYYR